MVEKTKSLKQQFFERCQQLSKAWSTAECYWGWNVKYMHWHHRRIGGRQTDWPKVNPVLMGRVQIEQYLTYIANELHVAPKTQNQAFSAILFLYKHVLDIKIENVDAMRATSGTYLPTVLSVDEVTGLMKCLTGRNRLVAYLCYGAGLRIGEVFALRMSNVDFENHYIHIRQAKGKKDRIVQLPEMAIALLRQQMDETERLYDRDVSANRARVSLPYAFAKKSPRSASDLGWYFVFSSQKYLDENNNQHGYSGRWHLDPTTFTRPLADAVRAARPRILKHVTSHCLRHSFATHMMNSSVPLVEIKELMGHSSLDVTSIYLHVQQKAPASNRSPLDQLALSQ